MPPSSATHSGFAIGGVPPFGWTGATPVVPTLVDEDLLAHDEVWAAAGTPTEVFPLTPGRARAAHGRAGRPACVPRQLFPAPSGRA